MCVVPAKLVAIQVFMSCQCGPSVMVALYAAPTDDLITVVMVSFAWWENA
jgi:hypothetical protein